MVQRVKSLKHAKNEVRFERVFIKITKIFAKITRVDPFWGRENPREHGRYTSVSKTGQKCSICHDFAPLSLINVDFEERFERVFVKIMKIFGVFAKVRTQEFRKSV